MAKKARKKTTTEVVDAAFNKRVRQMICDTSGDTIFSRRVAEAQRMIAEGGLK